MKNEVKIVDNIIIIDYNGTRIFRPLNNIRFCEALSHYCEIYFDTVKPVVAPIAISKLEQMLPKNAFYKCHRRIIIHFDILNNAEVKEDKIYYNKYILPISRNNFSEFINRSEAFRF